MIFYKTKPVLSKPLHCVRIGDTMANRHLLPALLLPFLKIWTTSLPLPMRGALTVLPLPVLKKIIRQGFSKNEQFTEYHFSLPRYFAVFFNNQKPNILSDANIRKALVQGANKQALIEKIITEVDTEATAVDSPILPDFFGYQEQSKGHEFNTENAKALLDASGFVDKGNGVREKVVTKKPAFQFKNYLKVGSKGTEVTQLQGCLARLPNLSGSNTTIFSDILKNETNGVYRS